MRCVKIMAIYQFEDRNPKIGKNSYVHERADVIGDVELGDGCWIGPGAVLRGDYGKIVIGSRTSIEDNCVIHARPGKRCVIGSNVTIGHGAIIHNSTISDWVVVGMGAIASDFSEIGEWAVLAEGCVVRNHQIVPPSKIVAGVPAKIIGDVSDDYKKMWTEFKKEYVKLARKYPRECRVVV